MFKKQDQAYAMWILSFISLLVPAGPVYNYESIIKRHLKVDSKSGCYQMLPGKVLRGANRAEDAFVKKGRDR